MDREAFFSLLSLESMLGEHLDLIRSISDHVDDDTFEDIAIGYLTRDMEPGDTVLDAVRAIEYALDGFCEDYDDTPVDDDDVVKAALFELKDRFAHIGLLFTIGRKDLAIEAMTAIADALSVVKDTDNFSNYSGYLVAMEMDIRDHIASDTPERWFGLNYSHDDMEDDTVDGQHSLFDQMEAYLPEIRYDEFLSLLESGEDDDRLREIVTEVVRMEFDYDEEVSLMTSISLDMLFDDLLEDGLKDDWAVEEYLRTDPSEVPDYLRIGFTMGFNLAILMEMLQMHDIAIEFVKEIADTIDDNLDRNEYPRGYVSDGLESILSMMRDSLSKDDALGWMDPDTREGLEERIETL